VLDVFRKKLNSEIFETIYFAAVSASTDQAKKDGPYETFKGSPASKGILQFDMWGVTPSPRWDWTSLKKSVVEHGLRNSLLVAPMPTASTSQILGNNECFEPFTSNIYTRRVLAGEFTIVNKYLLQDLIDRGLWNEDMKNRIVSCQGSIQSFPGVPDDLKLLYRTVWEIKQKDIIDMAADRGAFIDQSQSLNIFMSVPTKAKVTSMHFYAWKKGLKTGMYYLRTKPATNAIQFTVDQEKLKNPAETTTSTPVVEKRSTITVPTINPIISTLQATSAISGHSMVVTQEMFPTMALPNSSATSLATASSSSSAAASTTSTTSTETTSSNTSAAEQNTPEESFFREKINFDDTSSCKNEEDCVMCGS